MNQITPVMLASVLNGMEGWCTTEKAMKLCRYITSENLKMCLEIGVYGGMSILAMALAQKVGDINGLIVGIDPWRNCNAVEGEDEPKNIEWWSHLDLHDIHKKCMTAIWDKGFADKIMIIRNTSEAAANLLVGQEWDLIHIDGGHAEQVAMRDIKTWVPRVRKGGVLVYDDLGWSTSGVAVPTLKTMLPMIEEVNGCGFFRA